MLGCSRDVGHMLPGAQGLGNRSGMTGWQKRRLAAARQQLYPEVKDDSMEPKYWMFKTSSGG
jgi:hypothetical protein